MTTETSEQLALEPNQTEDSHTEESSVEQVVPVVATEGDPALLEDMKSQYPESLWAFFTQKELTPAVDEVFDDITDIDNLNLNHIDDLKRLAVDKKLWLLDPAEEPAARAPHLALLVLSVFQPKEPEFYQQVGTLLMMDEINTVREQAIQSLLFKTPEPASQGLMDLFDQHSGNIVLRFRILYYLLPLTTGQDNIQRMQQRIRDFFNQTNDTVSEETLKYNTELIDLLCLTVESSQDPSYLELLPTIEEVYAEDRVDKESYPLEHVDAVFGDLDLSVEDLQEMEPTSTVYLRCMNCYRVHPYTAEQAYIDPVVLHANVTPDESLDEEEIQAKEIESVWIPEPVTCPDCGHTDAYDLSVRGYKRALAAFIRIAIAQDLGTDEDSIYDVMDFKFMGRYDHPLTAMTGCREAVEKYPDSAGFRIELARYLTHQKKYDEAYDHLLRAAKDDPTEPGSYRGLAYISEMRGETEQTVEWFLRLQKQLPKLEVSQSEKRALKKLVEDSLLRLRGAKFATQHTQAKVGRNDPCPCGSGNKYKKCCMREKG